MHHLGTRSTDRRKAMTLVEVMVSLTILLLVMFGLIGTMIQSRVMTEGSIRRNLATNLVTSYLEQMKGMTTSSLLLTPIPTQYDQVTADYLYPSSGVVPELTQLTPGTTPAANTTLAGNSSGTTCVDNLKDFPLYTSSSSGAAYSSWGAVWPGATSVPSTTAYQNDFQMNVWVWVSDMASSSSGAVSTGSAYAVTIIYTWRVDNGGRASYFTDEVRAIISSVSAYN